MNIENPIHFVSRGVKWTTKVFIACLNFFVIYEHTCPFDFSFFTVNILFLLNFCYSADTANLQCDIVLLYVEMPFQLSMNIVSDRKSLNQVYIVFASGVLNWRPLCILICLVYIQKMMWFHKCTDCHTLNFQLSSLNTPKTKKKWEKKRINIFAQSYQPWRPFLVSDACCVKVFH